MTQKPKIFGAKPLTALNGTERMAYCILALSPIELSEEELSCIIQSKAVEELSPDLKRFCLHDALPRWKNLGIARKGTLHFDRWSAQGFLRVAAARQTLGDGSFDGCCAAIEEVVEKSCLKHALEQSAYSGEWMWPLYFIRKYYARRDASALKKTLGILSIDDDHARWCLKFFVSHLSVAADFDLSSLEVFPESSRSMLLKELFWCAPGELRLKILDEQEKLCRKTADSDLASLLALRFCDAGRFERAAALRPLLDRDSLNRFEAIDCLVRGEKFEAKKRFQRLLRFKKPKNDVLPPADLWELFYVPLLASLHESPDTIRKVARQGAACFDRRCGGGAFDAAEVLALNNPADQAAAFMKKRAPAAADAAIEAVLPQALRGNALRTAARLEKDLEDAMELETLVFIMFLARWAAPETARRWAPLYPPLARRLYEEGLSFFASELEACALAPTEKDGGHHPLRDLIAPEPLWKRSLDALESLTGGGSAAAAENRRTQRILWTVGFEEDSFHEKDVSPFITLTPRVQTLRADGRWSRGREIPLSAVASGFEKYPEASEQTRKVADAVTEHNLFGRRSYDLDVPKALLLLAGSPDVARDDTLCPVEVIREEPLLKATALTEGCRLTMTPSNPDGRDIVVKAEENARIRVFPFTDAQKNLCALLGSSGIAFPASALPRAQKALSRLGSTVTVQSDLQSALPAAEADGRLRVRLSPAGEGLNVEFVVRPFGDSGISCRPGGGGAVLFGTLPDGGGNGKRVKRDLDAEKKRLRDAIDACPALTDGNQLDEGSWHIDDTEKSLELLLQFQSLPELIVEWPRGEALTLRASLDSSALQGAIQGSGTDWFRLNGVVAVDNQLTLSIKQLLALAKQSKSRFIPLGNRQFAALTQEFRRRLEELDSLCVEKSDGLAVSALAAPAVASLFDEKSLAGDEKWREICSRFNEACRLRPEIPRALRARLRPYQIEGFQWLVRLGHWDAGACLADDMGLGKTLQALALLLYRASQGPALVVAPTSVCGNWADEAAKFAPTLAVKTWSAADVPSLADLGPFDVFLTSYGMLQNHADDFAKVRWNTIVLDEAQAVKNVNTQRSDAVMKLSGNFKMIMTGTPVENHLTELWNLFRFINPGLLGSLAAFKRRFVSPSAEDGAEATQNLRRLIAPFLLRRLKSDVLDDLPQHTEITLKIDLSPQELACYEALRQSAVDALEDGNWEFSQDRRFAVFAHLMKLRRCCCAPSLVSEAMKNVPSSKLEALLELAEEMNENGRRALIFSQFVDYLKLLEAALKARGFSCLYLDGSTPAARRDDLVRAFQSGQGDFFLISLRAGGTGLNLTGADCVVHMDPWWNPAVEDQASDRAYRIGQSRPVTVYRLMARGTVEEKIAELHRTKRLMAESLLEGAGHPETLSLDDLTALIRGEPLTECPS